MDWINQSEEMVRSWSRIQEEMWDRTLEAAKAAQSEVAATGESDSPATRRVAEIWRESVLRALQAQVQWTRIWSERLAERAGTPPAVAESARRFHTMVETWTVAQSRLWKAWFDTVGRLDPKAASSTAWVGLMKQWQEAATNALEAQSEWAKRWTGSGPARSSTRGASNATKRRPSTRKPRSSRSGRA